MDNDNIHYCRRFAPLLGKRLLYHIVLCFHFKWFLKHMARDNIHYCRRFGQLDNSLSLYNFSILCALGRSHLLQGRLLVPSSPNNILHNTHKLLRESAPSPHLKSPPSSRLLLAGFRLIVLWLYLLCIDYMYPHLNPS